MAQTLGKINSKISAWTQVCQSLIWTATGMPLLAVPAPFLLKPEISSSGIALYQQIALWEWKQNPPCEFIPPIDFYSVYQAHHLYSPPIHPSKPTSDLKTPTTHQRGDSNLRVHKAERRIVSFKASQGYCCYSGECGCGLDQKNP